MPRILFTIVSFCVATALLSINTHGKLMIDGTSGVKDNSNGFVVMELFTSQGCSSCPVADDLVASYIEKNDSRIIAIAFHVDYWDKLGWRDPFSNSQNSQRQSYYDESFLHTSVYTPQMIVNGTKEMVGSDESMVESAVDNALKEAAAATINIKTQTISNGQLQIDYTIQGAATNAVLNMALIQHKTVTKIKAGENRGSTLTNYNVVRSFVSSPANASGSSFIKLPVGIGAKELSVVLFTQNKSTGKITGALKKDL